MANWYGLSRTNYFKVRDDAAFLAWAATLPDVELIDDGKGRFGFYTNGDGQWPCCRYQEDNTCNDFDFAEELADHLAEGEVAILITVGHEKARYATGFAVAIRHDHKRLEIDIDRIYRRVLKTWGIAVTRAEY